MGHNAGMSLIEGGNDDYSDSGGLYKMHNNG